MSEPKLYHAVEQIHKRIEFLKGKEKTNCIHFGFLTESNQKQLKSLGYKIRLVTEKKNSSMK